MAPKPFAWGPAMTRKLGVLVILALAPAAAWGSNPGEPGEHQTDTIETRIPGTYEIKICEVPCKYADVEKVMVRGIVVLTEEPFNEKALSLENKVDFEYVFSMIGHTNV